MSIIDGKTVLQEIQEKAKTNWDQSTGDAAKGLYSLLYDLIGEVIRIDKQSPMPDPLPIPSQLANCLAENQKLKTELEKLNSLMNWQSDILHKIASALQADNLTSSALVAHATNVMTELIALRKGGSKLR